MSTSAISSSLLSQIAGSPTQSNDFVTNLNQLSKDLQSSNLSAAQQDYLTLSSEALNGATASTATSLSSGITGAILSQIALSASGSAAFAGELNQLGSDLSSGNLSSSEADMVSLDTTALSGAGGAGTSAAASTATSKADISTLIQGAVAAMAVGDDSAVSADLGQLATLSPDSQGASLLKSDGESFGSGSSSASTNPVEEYTGGTAETNSAALLSAFA